MSDGWDGWVILYCCDTKSIARAMLKMMVIIRMTLLPGASTWTPLTSLPRGRFSAQVSTVGGALRLIGGDDDVGNSVLDEVRYRKINL